MKALVQKIDEAYRYIQEKTNISHLKTAVILGTGLDQLVKEVDVNAKIAYTDIPHFPTATVEFHKGNLIIGTLLGKPLLIMQGRFHFYEGYSMEEVTFPIRVMHRLGIKTLVISNASGGMNPNFQKGDLAVICDHINLLGSNPLIGTNLDDFGPRFPDMSEPYREDLVEKAEKIAIEHGFTLKRSVYVAVSGPSLETRAEYRFLRAIGADIVGMSTVPEVIVARHQAMNVLGLSIITDECFPDVLHEVDISEIISVAREAEPRLILIIKSMVQNYL